MVALPPVKLTRKEGNHENLCQFGFNDFTSLVSVLAEHDMPAEIVPISLRDGEHLTPEFAALNPNKSVPTLQEDDFVLTECSAILKYLAEKTSSPTYPKDLKARARVNAAMDWFNTGFCRDLGYGAVYPQILPHYAFKPRPMCCVAARNVQPRGLPLSTAIGCAPRIYCVGPGRRSPTISGAATSRSPSG